MNWKRIKIRCLKALQSKYGLTALLALVWVTFAADIDLVHIMRTAYEVNQLNQEADLVTAEVEQVREDLDDLLNNQASLERFARERYFMQRSDEDVFRIIERAQ